MPCAGYYRGWCKPTIWLVLVLADGINMWQCARLLYPSPQPCNLCSSSLKANISLQEFISHKISSSLFQELLPSDLRSILVTMHSLFFPYQNAGKANFICEYDDVTHPPFNKSSSDCSICSAKVQLDRLNARCILEHMAAHILYDTTINGEACGLCLQQTPMCQLVLKKGWGADLEANYSLDLKKSTCAKLLQFQRWAVIQIITMLQCANNMPLVPCQEPRGLDIYTSMSNIKSCLPCNIP